MVLFVVIIKSQPHALIFVGWIYKREKHELKKKNCVIEEETKKQFVVPLFNNFFFSLVFEWERNFCALLFPHHNCVFQYFIYFFGCVICVCVYCDFHIYITTLSLVYQIDRRYVAIAVVANKSGISTCSSELQSWVSVIRQKKKENEIRRKKKMLATKVFI